MPFRLSFVTTVTLLLLSACHNYASSLRGRANPAAPGALGTLGADRVLKALGRRVSLQERIVRSMRQLDQRMASLSVKNDRLQQLNEDEQMQEMSRFTQIPLHTAQNSRFRGAPPVGPYGAMPISLLHPVLPVAVPQPNNNSSSPVAYMSYNTFGNANIPLPQPQTTFMGPHSLGFPLNPSQTVRGVGLPGPALYPPVAHVPSYPVNMVSTPYFDPRGYPSSIVNLPTGAAFHVPTNDPNNKNNNQTQGNGVTPYPVMPMVVHGAQPYVMPSTGYPLINPPTPYTAQLRGGTASPYAGAPSYMPQLRGSSPYLGTQLPVHLGSPSVPVPGLMHLGAPGLTPAFVGGYSALPVDSMGYPLPVPGSPSAIPTPKNIDSKGKGSGKGAAKPKKF